MLFKVPELKNSKLKINFLISKQDHMLYVVKRNETILLSTQKHALNLIGKKRLTSYSNYLLTLTFKVLCKAVACNFTQNCVMNLIINKLYAWHCIPLMIWVWHRYGIIIRTKANLSFFSNIYVYF